MSRRRILVLEDHDRHRRMLDARLRSFPTCATVFAFDRLAPFYAHLLGQYALPRLDAAILDVQLPDGSGLDVIPLLGEDCRIIIATASPDDVPAELARAYPVVAKGPGWIAKIEELLRQ